MPEPAHTQHAAGRARSLAPASVNGGTKLYLQREERNEYQVD